MELDRALLTELLVAEGLDIARQMIVGSPPAGLVERLEGTVALQEVMLQAIHPGLTVADAYARTTEAVAPWCADDPSFVFQFHGIGWEVHEPPRFCSPNKPFFPLPPPGQPDDVPLGEHTVACLELGTGGAWIEDMVVLHATGYERLTTLPQTILTP